MAIKFCTTGLVWSLDGVRTKLATSPYAELRLFKNNYTPVLGSAVSDFTEADFTGYSSIDLDSWGSVTTDGDNNAVVEETNRTFTQTADSPANDIYGYYVVEHGTGFLLYAERAPDAPFAMDADGKTYTVRPKLVLRNFGG